MSVGGDALERAHALELAHARRVAQDLETQHADALRADREGCTPLHWCALTAAARAC
jgi:hypothetical protein